MTGLKNEKKNRERTKFLSATCRWGAVFGLLVMFMAMYACNGDKDQDDGLSPEERAKKQILDSFITPPDAKLKDVKILEEKNILIASYGSQESIDFIEKFFTERINREGHKIHQKSPQGLTYDNGEGKQIGVLWFPRDPDLSEYKCVFRMSYMPLPPELKKKTAEKEQ